MQFLFSHSNSSTTDLLHPGLAQTTDSSSPIISVSKHEPKIYLLPNMMTAGNLFCGFAAVLKIIEAALLNNGGEPVTN